MSDLTCADCGRPLILDHRTPYTLDYKPHTPRVAAPEGLSLDQPRLIEALLFVNDHHAPECGAECPVRMEFEELVPRIAAEYARLSPSSGESGSPPDGAE